MKNKISHIEDNLRLALDSIDKADRVDLDLLRANAEKNIEKSQSENRTYYDKRYKKPHSYKVGDYVMMANVDTTPEVNKKLISKYREPYTIKDVLPNDRYAVTDIIGF
ncbi:hypothetical protein NQ314_013189 [Rhamnusium bicolor]|uniref:Uncharacterized protein n=1 Tax=Rhamnusium bicolor TaxID=1586634 RepID=A0AAV8X8K0_9CUCU|nr:hypothetical protein NQ314_013189 [Rhamnusium bicolor]